MPIDIDDLRAFKGGNPEAVRESERRRFNDTANVDVCIALDDEWRALRGEADRLRKAKNSTSKQIPKYKKEGKDIAPLLTQSKQISQQIASTEQQMKQKAVERDRILQTIGNYVHDSVPVHEEEEAEDGTLLNQVESTWGEDRRRFMSSSKKQNAEGEAKADAAVAQPGGGPDGAILHHHELLQMLGGYDPSAGIKVAGARTYFLRGAGVSLNFALQLYAQNFLVQRGYTLLQPPYFMRKKVMAGVAQLAEFDETLYHVGGGDESESAEDTEKYLIATSEQPICGYHQNETFTETQLAGSPIKYGGCSTCFRKEAGKSGKDIWGIFRVHQFEKVEQFIICHPDESWAVHEEMLQQAKTFTESLGLPYRVVNIVSGELNNAAAKKYDMEAWFPGYDDYREIVSCSNCTDYQARSMNIRCGQAKSKKGGQKAGEHQKKKYVHMLNSTLCACTRVICAILENFQAPEGVYVPEVLIPYMPAATLLTNEETGRKYLPFVQKLKRDKSAEKAAKGAAKKKARKQKAAKKKMQEQKSAQAPPAPSTSS